MFGNSDNPINISFNIRSLSEENIRSGLNEIGINGRKLNFRSFDGGGEGTGETPNFSFSTRSERKLEIE